MRWGGKRGVGGELNEAINKIIFYPTKKITAWHCTTNSSAAAPPPPPPPSRHRTGAELHAPRRLARGGGGRQSHARACAAPLLGHKGAVCHHCGEPQSTKQHETQQQWWERGAAQCIFIVSPAITHRQWQQLYNCTVRNGHST